MYLLSLLAEKKWTETLESLSYWRIHMPGPAELNISYLILFVGAYNIKSIALMSYILHSAAKDTSPMLLIVDSFI